MIDRATAAQLNPIIDRLCARETLANACDALTDLATLPSSADHAGVEICRFDLLVLHVRAALAFEVEILRAEIEVRP